MSKGDNMCERMSFDLKTKGGWRSVLHALKQHRLKFYGFWHYFLKDTFGGHK